MPQEASPPTKTPTGLGLINPFEGMFNIKMDDFFGPSTPNPTSSKQSLGGGYLSGGYGSMGTGPGSISSSVTYGDDLSPSQESSARTFSNGYSGMDDVASKKASSPIKILDGRQRVFEGKDDAVQNEKTQQARAIQRESPSGGIVPAGDTKEEADCNRRNNFDSNIRRPQNQVHYNNINK